MSRLDRFWKYLRFRIKNAPESAADDALNSERDPCTREVQLAAYHPPVRNAPR